jgi:signal transduction histidine kinase
MSPPPRELVTLGIYLSFTGGAAIIGGCAVLGSERIGLKLGLRQKVFLASALGGALALLNVLIVARLMFVSTSHDLWVLAASLAFSVAVMALFSLYVAVSVAERVDVIAKAVRSLANDQVTDGVFSRLDEVARLASDVDRLAEKLRAAEDERARIEEDRRQLTTSISHDLRTPVANVRAIAEALSSGVLENEAEKSHYVGLIQREAERLSRMIDDLFDLARLDAGVLRLETRHLQLEEIAADVVEAMRPEADRRGLHLELLRPQHALPASLVDGARMERVISNLLRNAIEHTSGGGVIEVALEESADWIALSIRDSGDGIEESQLERIWERFYREDKARGRLSSASGDGAGLGLSIVRGLVEAHGGNVKAASHPGSGSIFTVTLPVNR